MRNVNEIIDFDSRRIFIAVATEAIAGRMIYSEECDKKLLKKVIILCNNDVVKCLGECSYHDTKELFGMAYMLIHKSNEHILGKCEASQIQIIIKDIIKFIKIIENKV